MNLCNAYDTAVLSELVKMGLTNCLCAVMKRAISCCRYKFLKLKLDQYKKFEDYLNQVLDILPPRKSLA